MKDNLQKCLLTSAIIALVGVCNHAAAANTNDFSLITDIDTLSFDRDGSRAKEAGGFSFSTNVDYGTGKYGGSQSIEILQIPLLGKYVNGPWAFKLAVPYIRITDPGNTANASPTESGLGDVVTSAAYILYKDNGADPLLVDMAIKVKFGTASQDKGLGTGENDYAVQSSIDKTVGKFTASGMVGYRVNGNPAGAHLDNVFYGSLSGNYDFTPQTSASLILDQRQQASITGALHRKLTALFSHKITKNWKTQAYMVKGLANGSADWDGGATVTYAFK
ncbi:MAG: transporter [Sulfuricella sp.]